MSVNTNGDDTNEHGQRFTEVKRMFDERLGPNPRADWWEVYGDFLESRGLPAGDGNGWPSKEAYEDANLEEFLKRPHSDTEDESLALIRSLLTIDHGAYDEFVMPTREVAERIHRITSWVPRVSVWRNPGSIAGASVRESLEADSQIEPGINE